MPGQPGENKTTRYQIRIDGHLKHKWSDWLGNSVAVKHSLADGSSLTTVTTAVQDQAALRGILNKLWDLNLKIISVRILEEDNHG